MYMVHIPVYSVYAIYRRVKSVGGQCVYGAYTCILCICHIQERQVSVVDSVYMVHIPVYSVYAMYRRDKSVWWAVCIWCIYLYIVYMPYTGETSQCGGQCVYGAYTCI